MSTTRENWVRGERATLTTHHEVMIAVKQANLDKLDVMLQERSTPGTPLYRQWMSFEEIGAVTANPTALTAIKAWLQENNIHISWVSPRNEYILASAPISTWNKVLKTEFFEYHDTHEYSSLVLQRQGLRVGRGEGPASSAGGDKVTLLRAEQCFVPSHLSDHIVGIFHTTQVSLQPPPLSPSLPLSLSPPLPPLTINRVSLSLPHTTPRPLPSSTPSLPRSALLQLLRERLPSRPAKTGCWSKKAARMKRRRRRR
jgi:hypothetical protein